MIRLRDLSLVVLVGGAVFSLPAAAQSRDGSRSLTHMVSVTVPPRVKVKVSAPSMLRSNGLALSVSANRPWVLMVKSSTADTLVAAGSGTGPAVDTAVVFGGVPKSDVSSSADQAVILTVASP